MCSNEAELIRTSVSEEEQTPRFQPGKMMLCALTPSLVSPGAVGVSMHPYPDSRPDHHRQASLATPKNSGHDLYLRSNINVDMVSESVPHRQAENVS